MLDREDDQHQHGADHEGRVEVHRAEAGNVEGVSFPAADEGCQRRHRIGGGNGLDGIGRRRAGIGGDVVDDRLRGVGVIRHVGGDPVQHQLRVGSGNGEQRVEDVARRDGAAQRQDRAPGEPVAPHGKRRDELRIAQPGRCSVYGSAARLVGEHAGDFGIGEGLQEAHDHRDDPHQEGKLARGAGDAADGEEHEGRHAGRDPEGALPVQCPDEFARVRLL